MTDEEKLAAIKEAAQGIIDLAQSEDRELTDDEQKTLDEKLAEAQQVKARMERGRKSADLVARIGALPSGSAKTAGTVGDDQPAKTLGEHFVNSVGEQGLERIKTVSGVTVSAPEYKAAADTHQTPGTFAPFLTDYDRTIVREYRRPVVSDLLGTGTLSGNAVTYLVEGAVEGGFGMVAAGGAKPQMHFTDPTTRTDALKKIAGFLKFTDEMAEDAPFWVSEINQRGLYLLSLAEENQLLNGSGTGNNVQGLLNRSGIQTEVSAANAVDRQESIFRAMTKVQTATGLTADAVAINPLDYQAFRLAKDANNQYYGGGFFSGQYGVGGVLEQPPLWGLRTVVTQAVASGTAVVGAFGVAATVYRKGGVRVESTNSHESDFTNNLITTRIEERVALAVRIPAAFVKVTLTPNA